MSKIKIGYYSVTNQLGGSEVYLRDVIKHVDRKKYHVLLFCNRKHTLLKEIDEGASLGNLDVIYIDKETDKETDSCAVEHEQEIKEPQSAKKSWLRFLPSSLKLFLGTVKDILRLKKIFQNNVVKVLHFNDTGCEPPVIAARLAGVYRITGTYHVEPSYDKEKMDWVRRLIEYISTRCMHSAIAVSNGVKTAWKKRVSLKGNNINVIYNGIDLERIDIDPKKERQKVLSELKIDDCRHLICVPARLHVMKGHKYLFEAIPKIQQSLSGIQFVCVGKGELKDELEELAQKLKISKVVHFMGFRRDILNIMAASDLIVLPSISLEALPYVLIEAMALSKPIVATNFSGIPEIVEDHKTGILVPRKNPAALCEAVINLLSDEESAINMGVAGHERALRNFDRKRMLKDTYDFYEKLVNE